MDTLQGPSEKPKSRFMPADFNFKPKPSYLDPKDFLLPALQGSDISKTKTKP